MKKLHKLAAAVAVAAGIALSPQANAVIELKSNGVGDALIFPVFNGSAENYFTISNNHNRWVAGHIRFRGAAWSGELLDFPVILSPGDVFIFRLADTDGDGNWEIDQSLDPRNFAYSNQLCADQMLRPNPLYPIIPATVNVTPAPGQTPIQASNAVIQHHRRAGYVEFFGTAVLEGMTPAIMERLLNSDNQPNQNRIANACNNNSRRGTSVWAWSDAGNAFVADLGLSDVPNVLSGSAFISLPSLGPTAIAYNAEALTNFRTPLNCTTGGQAGNHRVEGYVRRAALTNAWTVTGYGTCTDAQEDGSVILYNEDANAVGVGAPASAAASLATAYLYRCALGEDVYERMVSFNNTWGPTLADGDSYFWGGAARLSPYVIGSDDWDVIHEDFNSVAEVEEAIRLEGQTFHGVYFDSSWFDKFSSRMAQPASTNLKSYYFVHFPTKFYYGENKQISATSCASGDLTTYLQSAVDTLLRLAKPVTLQVWDTLENTPTTSGCVTSPCITESRPANLGHELSFFSVGFFKQVLGLARGANDTRGSTDNFRVGRVVLDSGSNNPNTVNWGTSWPMLGYTFEMRDSDSNIGQWRAMQR